MPYNIHKMTVKISLKSNNSLIFGDFFFFTIKGPWQPSLVVPKWYGQIFESWAGKNHQLRDHASELPATLNRMFPEWEIITYPLAIATEGHQRSYTKTAWKKKNHSLPVHPMAHPNCQPWRPLSHHQSRCLFKNTRWVTLNGARERTTTRCHQTLIISTCLSIYHIDLNSHERTSSRRGPPLSWPSFSKLRHDHYDIISTIIVIIIIILKAFDIFPALRTLKNLGWNCLRFTFALMPL